MPPWAEALARILDTALPIPGTRIRFGLDAVLGLVAPGVGDAITAAATAAFLWTGFRRGAPKIVLLRMVLNLLLDALVGAIPVFGDVFDVFHRAATKNLDLARRYAIEQYHPTFGDYAFVALLFGGLLVLLLTPLAIALTLAYAVVHRWG
ncbi:MAG: DUF4112 domain-containing protein [Myxococcales bacterium]